MAFPLLSKCSSDELHPANVFLTLISLIIFEMRLDYIALELTETNMSLNVESFSCF